MEMLKVALFDGAKPNNTAKVSSTGKLEADVTGSEVDVSGSEVDATIGPALADVETIRSAIGTTSAELLDIDATRTQIVLQNLSGSASLHINQSGDDATTDDLKIGPGASFSFPMGIAYTGKIQIIASGADTPYVCIVYRRS